MLNWAYSAMTDRLSSKLCINQYITGTGVNCMIHIRDSFFKMSYNENKDTYSDFFTELGTHNSIHSHSRIQNQLIGRLKEVFFGDLQNFGRSVRRN